MDDIADTSMDTEPTDPRLQTLLTTICPYSPLLVLCFSLAALFALFSLLVVLAKPRGSPPFVVALLTIFVDSFIMSVVGTLLYLCRKSRVVG